MSITDQREQDRPSAIHAHDIAPGDFIEIRLIGRHPAEWAGPYEVTRTYAGLQVCYQDHGREWATPDDPEWVRKTAE